jgi:hypothetical protein
MPKLAAKPSEVHTELGPLTPNDLAKAASFADVVVQSVTARRGSRTTSGVVPAVKSLPVHVPAAPRLPTLDSRVTGERSLVFYAILAGVVVGVLVWCAVRYL